MFLIKKILIDILRYIFKVAEVFVNVKPNRILFTTFNGKGYFCNPKYLSLELEKSGKYDIVWVLNDKQSLPNIICVKFMSLKYFYFYLSSRFIITNQGFKSFIPKPKTQIRMETWHGGGAYKKTDLAIIKDKFLSYKYILAGDDIDYYISSSKKFSEVMSYAQHVGSDRFLPYGMPRNDIFFDETNKKLQNKIIRDKYGISFNCKIILYAPTWRDDGRSLDVDNLGHCVDKLNINNPKYVLLYRAHLGDELKCKSNNVINVSSYPDMQELLCAADILITDYSSCMWDFSLMFKPCFIYATDIDQYKQERDFYTPMSEWPFPIATNNEELVNNIINFDEAEYIEKVKQHHKALGSYEDGHATERACKLIEKICSEEK